MAAKHPLESLTTIADLSVPEELAPQMNLLKKILLEIDLKKNSADSSQSKVECQAEGKKPKSSSTKSQLTACKKELNEAKEEINKVKKALELITEMRTACLASFTSMENNTMQSQKLYSPVILKETAEMLPLWVVDDKRNTVPPLCGAVQVDENYVAKVGDMVAAFVVVKGKSLKDWILAEVSDYNPATECYKVCDIDDALSLPHAILRVHVIPLPTMRADPVEAPQAIFPKGSFVLALYENTTCFYKGIVHEPPRDSQELYQIAFEDGDCESGYSSPLSVPQRYVLAFRDLGSS